MDDRACDHASTPVVTRRPEMELHEAAELMVRHGIQRLPVLDGDRLTGIVTLTTSRCAPATSSSRTT